MTFRFRLQIEDPVISLKLIIIITSRYKTINCFRGVIEPYISCYEAGQVPRYPCSSLYLGCTTDRNICLKISVIFNNYLFFINTEKYDYRDAFFLQNKTTPLPGEGGLIFKTKCINTPVLRREWWDLLDKIRM